MITLAQINMEIEKLREGELTWSNIDRLNTLLKVRKGLMHYDEHEVHMMPMEHEKKELPKGEIHELDRKTAEEWVSEMFSQHSMGEHWDHAQTDKVLHTKGWNLNADEFYAVMNALWSDYNQTAKRYGVDTVEFWACMAKDWLTDEDAGAHKAYNYYNHVVAH